jgi:SAM-dependent methyltransferase
MMIPLRIRLYDWKNEGFPNPQLRDVTLYDYLARETDGPLLELGCGTGRVATQLADRGHEVVALDHDPDMIAAARLRADDLDPDARDRLRLTEGDMREFELDERFGLVCIPYNTFQCLHTLDDQRRCLQAIRRHLAVDGRLALQLTPFQRLAEPADCRHRATARFGDHEAIVSIHERTRQEDTRQITHFDERYEVFWTDGTNEAVERTITLRTVYRYELQLLLEQAGFELDELYGSFDREPYDATDGDLMLPVASLAR